MDTEGLLRDVPVSELLLQLGEQGFTGILKMQARVSEDKKDALKLLFVEGEIVQVDSPTRAPDWRLGQLLVRGELVSAGDVEAAAERAGLRKKPIGAILVKEKKLHPGQLEDMLCMQFLEDLHRALSWRDGAFKFKPQQVTERVGAPEPLDPEEVVEMGLKHAERWPTIQNLVPSLDSAFVKCINGPIPAEEARRKKIGAQELKVFSLVHYSRTVRDLVPLSRLETFEVCRSLALLVHGDYIEPHRSSEPEILQPAKESAGKRIKKGVAFHGFTAFLVVVCLALVIGVFLIVREKSLKAQKPTDGTIAVASIDPVRDALTRAQMERIEVALEVYRQRQGDFPPRLDVLVDARLLSEDDLKYPDYEGDYKYRPTGDKYRLSRPKR